jgi:hypothetical protein
MLEELVPVDRPIPASVIFLYDFKKDVEIFVLKNKQRFAYMLRISVAILALGWAEVPLCLLWKAGPYHLTKQILHPFLLLPEFMTRHPASKFSVSRWWGQIEN